jgi:hypothetical protein
MLHARENLMPAALPCSHRLARMNMVYLILCQAIISEYKSLQYCIDIWL